MHLGGTGKGNWAWLGVCNARIAETRDEEGGGGSTSGTRGGSVGLGLGAQWPYHFVERET